MSHYIEAPRAYISGMATNPPHESKDDEMPDLCTDSDEYWTDVDKEIDKNVSAIELSQAQVNTIEGQQLLDTLQDDQREQTDYDDTSESSLYTQMEREFEQFDHRKVKQVKVYKQPPPNFDSNYSAGTYNNKKKHYNNERLEGQVDFDETKYEIEEIQHEKDINQIENVYTKNVYKIVRKDEVEDVFHERVEFVRDTNDQWFVHVPIKYDNGKIGDEYLFADPGANAACINEDYAYKHFRDSICTSRTKIAMSTPGGPVKPNKCIWMSFPTKSGILLKAKLYLIKGLKQMILADINMLKAFGYKFKDETPPIFKHDEKEDLNLEMKETDEMLSNRNEINEINYKTTVVENTQLEDTIGNDKMNNEEIADNSQLVVTINGYDSNEDSDGYQQERKDEEEESLAQHGQYDKTPKERLYQNSKDYKYNWFKSRLHNKRYQLNIINSNYARQGQLLSIFDKICSGNNILYQSINDEERNINTISNDIDDVDKIDVFKDKNKDKTYKVNEVTDVSLSINTIDRDLTELDEPEVVDCEYEYEVESHIRSINSIIDVINNENKSKDEFDYGKLRDGNGVQMSSYPIFYKMDKYGNSYGNCPIYYQCLFIRAKQVFKATEEEIAEAEKLMDKVDEKLSFINFDYLKEFGKKYGYLYEETYDIVSDFVDENGYLFAKRTFSRRTMTVAPARLGIAEEHRDKTMFAPQYPISPIKRVHMIIYTIKNEENGFWKRINYSLNCVPYTMVAKKKKGVTVRFRPAFDGRIVNQYCVLLICVMPTLKDFRDLHSIKGPTTMCDIKNMFDCIPLHVLDQLFAVAHSPLGLFMMLCLTYGWMNAAPEAQKITNQIALFIGDCLAYIDDICIKHRFELGAKDVKVKLERMAFIGYKFNLLWNPTKFIPCSDYNEQFAFQHSMIGIMMASSYQRKLLALKPPETRSEQRTLDGIMNYMDHLLYMNKPIGYWIKKLKEVTGEDGKHKRLKWNEQAKLSWEKLKWLFAHPILLHYPTMDGLFCVQTDACNYGIGAVLWQSQYDEDTNEEKWVIVDMWSKLMPIQLRHSHPMIHEAYAIASAVEHWQFYLIKRRFIISTDNLPVATIFGEFWKDLNPITQKQLIRLRTKLSMFCFNSYHVPGLENPIADGLSRHVMKLIDIDSKLPKDKQQFPLMLQTINSDDTKTPKLIKLMQDDNFDEVNLDPTLLKLANEESERLRLQFKELKRNRNKINYIMKNVNYIDITPNKNICNVTNEKDIYSIYKSQIKANDKSWNQLMQNYKNKYNYLQKLKVQQLIKQTDDLVNQVEDDMKDELFNDYNSNMKNITMCISKLSNKVQKHVSNIIWYDEKQLREENCILQQINQIDKEYDPREDPTVSDDDYSDTATTDRIVTRGMKRKQEQNKLNPQLDPEDTTIFDFTNVSMKHENEVMKSRHQFIEQLFGHRDDMDVLDFQVFNNYQQSDNVIRLVTELVHQDPSEWKQSDLDLIKQQDLGLYKQLKKNNIYVSLGMVEVRIYDKKTDSERIGLLVPFAIRGKLLDYAHHNLTSNHVNADGMLYNLRSYWWSTMKQDIKMFIDRCVLCQFTKGRPRTKVPLAVRILPAPTEHIFMDFLGPIIGKHHILVIVDARTGYVMLTPTDGTDALTVVNILVNKWIMTFGWFKRLETDWGAGFEATLTQMLCKIVGKDIELGEPRNHRSIGKAERTILMLQDAIQLINQALNQRFTKSIDSNQRKWNAMESIIPILQMGINQRRPRFTTFSPNMLIFGRNLNDLTDLVRIENKLRNFNKENKENISERDYNYLNNLIQNLIKVNKLFETHWQEYTWLSRRYYNQKNRITPESIQRIKDKHPIGSKVLYYIGDKQVAQYKWKTRWTGPWIVDKIINDTTMIIADPETGNQKRVTMDRIKKFNTMEFEPYRDVIRDPSYIEYQQQMLKRLTNHGVKFRKSDFELDFTIEPNVYDN